MENKKTIEYLNSKAWYRALKVMYILYSAICYSYATVGSMTIIYFTLFSPEEIIELNAFVRILLAILAIPVCFALGWIVVQIPKWIFYYIYLGKIKPEK